MAVFRYKAKHGPNDIVEGTIEAENQAAALNKLSFMGYFPISVSEDTRSGAGASTSSSKPKASMALFQRITIKDISAFTRQLADLLDSGVPLYRSVDILHEQATNPLFQQVLEDVKHSIKDGSTLHESLNRHPKVFSSLYINMVKSGEIGGMLESVLERLADFAEKEDETKSKIKSAMAYPMVMLCVGIFSVVFLLVFVIPRLTKLFSDMGQELPVPTQILIGVSSALTHYWWVIIISLVVVIYILRRWMQSSEGNIILDRLKLKIPVVKDLILKDEIARFGRTLSTLLSNGVPILQSLTIIVATIKNKVIQEEINGMVDDISKGAKLGECLKRCGYFPALFVNMVAVGEESGHIERALVKVAESYDKQVDRTIKVFTTLLEPLMIVVLGTILGGIVISMILPIFEISNIAQ